MEKLSKPPKERQIGGRGQTRGHGRGCGGRRGGRGGYWTNLTMAEEEEVGVVFTEEDRTLLEILRRK
jgi:hypothetical protein